DPLIELRRGHVITHVGVADARRNADRAATGGEEGRLADAEAASRREYAAGAKVRRVGEVDVRVVRDPVAHRAVEALHLVQIAVRTRARGAGERDDIRRVAVDEAC